MLWGKPLAQPVRPVVAATEAASRNSRVTSDMRSGLARDLGATGHQIDLGRTRIANDPDKVYSISGDYRLSIPDGAARKEATMQVAAYRLHVDLRLTASCLCR